MVRPPFWDGQRPSRHDRVHAFQAQLTVKPELTVEFSDLERGVAGRLNESIERHLLTGDYDDLLDGSVVEQWPATMARLERDVFADLVRPTGINFDLIQREIRYNLHARFGFSSRGGADLERVAACVRAVEALAELGWRPRLPLWPRGGVSQWSRRGLDLTLSWHSRHVQAMFTSFDPKVAPGKRPPRTHLMVLSDDGRLVLVDEPLPDDLTLNDQEQDALIAVMAALREKMRADESAAYQRYMNGAH